jgi:hypothetical protein
MASLTARTGSAARCEYFSVVALINFEGSNASCVVNGSVLISLDRLVVFAFECRELNIDPGLVASDLFLISYGVGFAQPGPTWQTVYTVALEDAINTCI